MRRLALLMVLGFGLWSAIANSRDPGYQAAHGIRTQRAVTAKSTKALPGPSQPRPVTSTSIERAIAFALAQRGKPYVYGATGPDAYDCSGLVQAAYHQAGIALPRTAAEQFQAGQRIYGRNHLRRGDLVYFTSPGPSRWHVGIYLGHGQMVEAAGEAQGIRIDAIDREGWRGAVRLSEGGDA